MKNKKNLKYAAILGSLVGALEMDAQDIVYTDINPDYVSSLNDMFSVDFDGDGTNELTLVKENSGGVSGNVNNSLTLEMPDETEVLGVFFGNPDFMYVDALENNAVISNGVEDFDNRSENLMAYGWQSYYGDGGGGGIWFFEDEEAFMGVKFDIDGNQHFGWVRLEVTFLASRFIIKDYAYNSVPNEPILAGEGIPPLDVPSNTFNDIDVISTSNLLRINNPSSFDLEIELFDMMGQKLGEYKGSDKFMEIPISHLSSGLFIARISNSNNQVIQKKFIK